MILVGGSIACAQMGDPNASIPTPQPIHSRPMFSSYGRSLESSSVTFVSNYSIQEDSFNGLEIKKEMLPVANTVKFQKRYGIK